MSLPGFSTESTLHRTGTVYREYGGGAGVVELAGVVPAYNICGEGSGLVWCGDTGKCVSPTCPPGSKALGEGPCAVCVCDPNRCRPGGELAPDASPSNGCPCVPACGSGEILCGNTCVRTGTDIRNCGGCGKKCQSNQDCENGRCVTCAPGLTGCNTGRTSSCVNLGSDSHNCGTCGTICPSGTTCVGGQCLCPDGDPPCDDQCCRELDQCCNGRCCPGTYQCCGDNGCCSDGSLGEPAQLCCRSGCADPQTDSNNCGHCGIACGAGQTCCGGVCTNLNTDNSNCGTCGNVCGPGLTCCNGTCTNILTDSSNCNGCGQVCPAGATCQEGQCICQSGDPPCGGGCCPELSYCCNNNLCCRDTEDCCGTVCCSDGSSGGPAENCCNGTCVNLDTDANNCGACGNQCQPDCAGGTALCTGGVCNSEYCMAMNCDSGSNDWVTQYTCAPDSATATRYLLETGCTPQEGSGATANLCCPTDQPVFCGVLAPPDVYSNTPNCCPSGTTCCFTYENDTAVDAYCCPNGCPQGSSDFSGCTLSSGD